MLVLVVCARPQPMKTLKQWRNWFWIIVKSLLDRLLIPSNFYECCMHETSGSEDCYKIPNYWANTTSYGHRSEDDDPDLSYLMTHHRIWLRDWNQSNHPKGCVLKSQDRKKETSKQELLAIPISAFQKRVSKIGKNTGIGILYLKGVTFKETR